MEKSRKWVSNLVVFAIIILIAVFLVGINLYSLSEYEPILRKPTTTGTIVVSQILKYQIDGETYYAPKLEFSFTVDGDTYQKSAVEGLRRVTFREPEGAMAIIEHYPRGTEVPVYYPTGGPNRAVFQSGVGNKINGTRSMLIISVVSMLVIVVVIYAFITKQFKYE